MSNVLKRADYRRLQRNQQKKEKTYTLTQAQIDKIINDSVEQALQLQKNKIKNDAVEEAVDTAFALMLVIPTNILANLYWEKSASKRIPIFLDECMSVYESIGAGSLTITELIEDTEKIGKLKLKCVERLKNVRERLKQNQI